MAHQFKLVKDALESLRKHELETNSRYAVFKASKNFGKCNTVKTVYWEDHPSVKFGRVEFSGTPFVVLGRRVFDCQFGKNRKEKRKLERQRQKTEEDHAYTKGKKFLAQDTKKLGCPAQCFFREICRFPTHKIQHDTADERFQMEQMILHDIHSDKIHYEHVIVAHLASIEDHTCHSLGQITPEPIDKRLASKIEEISRSGVCNLDAMRTILHSYVKDICIPLPHPSNKRFYPTDKIISNHMYKANKGDTKEEQHGLEDLIHEWQEKSGDFVYCRLKCKEMTPKKDNDCVEYGSEFLFIHQSKEQRRLLERYGTTVFLDATYKTTLYDLPLFFLAVKTNVDFQIVGTFMTEDETILSITEALQIMRQSFPHLQPSYFMTDFDESEISSIENVFEGATVLICDFHRNQAWERWTRKKENSMGHGDEIYRHLQKLANSPTEENFDLTLQNLQESEIWKRNTKLQNYIQRVWLPHKKRWSKSFRKGLIDIVAGTNNGLECHHRIFKKSYMHGKTTFNLTNMLKILIKEFFPSRYRAYVDKNEKFSGRFRKYSAEVPEPLRKRPRDFIKHCLENIELSKDINKNDVESSEDGFFHVATGRNTYKVCLGDEITTPSCDCDVWYRFHMPCKHMIAAITSGTDIQWHLLSPLYMQSVYCTVDDFEVIAENPIEPVDDRSENNEQCKENTRECQIVARDAVKKLMNLTYNVNSDVFLRKISTTVNCLLKEASAEIETSRVPLLPLARRDTRLKCRRRKSALKKRIGCVSRPTDIAGIGDSAGIAEGGNHQTKQHELYTTLLEIWKAEPSDEQVIQIGCSTLTRNSFHYLKNTLSDEIIDAYLWMLLKGSSILHINCVVATAIFQGQSHLHGLLKNVQFSMYDKCVAVVNQGGCHWILVIINPKEKTLLYIDPLGEKDTAMQTMLQHWYKFLAERESEEIADSITGTWVIQTIEHSIQPDGVSCGVYVLKFAENILSSQSLCLGWTRKDIEKERQRIGLFLLSPMGEVLRGQQPENTKDDIHVQDCTEQNIEDVVHLKDDDEAVIVEKVPKKRQLRNILKRKRSSFIYTEIKRQKKHYCVCKTQDDGRLFWQCVKCKDWFHPGCLNRDQDDSPEPFFCPDCLDKHIEDWGFVNMFEGDEEEENSKFLINTECMKSKIKDAYKVCVQIVSTTVEKSKLEWLQRHCSFINKKGTDHWTYGFGFGVFTQQALLCLEGNILKIFKAKKSLYSLGGVIKGIANEQIKDACRKNNFLAEQYIKKVLCKEAMIVIMQEVCGISYTEAEKAVSLTEGNKLSRCIKQGIEMSEEIKQSYAAQERQT